MGSKRCSPSGWEVALRLGELDGESAVIDNLEALHLLHALAVALDGREEALVELLIGHRVVPGIDEGRGRYGSSIGKGDVRFQGDLVGLIPLLVDGLRHLVVDLALSVVIHEAGIEHVYHTAAAVLVGHSRDEALLGSVPGTRMMAASAEPDAELLPPQATRDMERAAVTQTAAAERLIRDVCMRFLLLEHHKTIMWVRALFRI